MSRHDYLPDVLLAIGAMILGGLNLALFVRSGFDFDGSALDWLPAATAATGLALMVAITVRFYGRTSGGAGMVLFITGWAIVVVLGVVLTWALGNPETGSVPLAEPVLENLIGSALLVTSIPLVICGFGLLVNVAVSHLRGRSHGTAAIT